MIVDTDNKSAIGCLLLGADEISKRVTVGPRSSQMHTVRVTKTHEESISWPKTSETTILMHIKENLEFSLFSHGQKWAWLFRNDPLLYDFGSSQIRILRLKMGLETLTLCNNPICRFWLLGVLHSHDYLYCGTNFLTAQRGIL